MNPNVPAPPGPGGRIRGSNEASAPTSALPAQRRRSRRWEGWVAIAIVIAVLVALFVVPIPHPFTARVEVVAPSGTGEAPVTFPLGSMVSGTWSVTPNQSISFAVETAAGGTVISTSGVGGSFSFRAADADYLFVAVATGPVNATVTGSYSAPVL